MNITIVSSAENDDEALILLKSSVSRSETVKFNRRIFIYKKSLIAKQKER